MAALTEWLQLMLAEISRKRDDLESARAEETRRAAESAAPTTPASATVTSMQEARAARR
jgi:hypothetical protein